MKKLTLFVGDHLIDHLRRSGFGMGFHHGGQFEWRYGNLAHANGYQDLFGDMRFQDSSLNTTGSVIGFAGPNFYRGYNGGTVAAPVAMPTGSNGSNLMIVRGGFSLADSERVHK